MSRSCMQVLALGTGDASADSRSRVYIALDAVLAAPGYVVAPAVDTVVQRALVELRGSGTEPGTLGQLEAISLALAGLGAANRRGDAFERQSSMAAVARLANAWLVETSIH